MSKYFYLFRLAVQNLRRGGQRIWVAWLCIAFGIMALVAMTMLAESIEKAVVLTPAELLGGDLSIVRTSGDTLQPADAQQLQQLRQAGAVDDYTLMAYNTAVMFHAPGSGDMHFAGIAMGIQPQNYPLAGRLSIETPENASLMDLLEQVGDVILTQDVAEAAHLSVGDPIVLSDLQAGVPVPGVVRGIASDTPNHQGDKLYYSLQTAEAMNNGQSAVNTVIANSSRPEELVAQLDKSGWTVDWAAERGAGKTANLWVIGLRGAENPGAAGGRHWDSQYHAGAFAPAPAGHRHLEDPWF